MCYNTGQTICSLQEAQRLLSFVAQGRNVPPKVPMGTTGDNMDQQHPPAQPHQEDPEAERSLLAELLESSRLYHTGEDYLDLLDFTSHLRNFAPFNAVRKRHGVESKSKSYLADHIKPDTTIKDLDIYVLLKAAGQVETALGIAAQPF